MDIVIKIINLNLKIPKTMVFSNFEYILGTRSMTKRPLNDASKRTFDILHGTLSSRTIE